jgi:mono/diheme cytochrome c family protein
VLLALTSGQKAGLALMAAAFIVFALLSSMVISHRRPEFPGRRLGVFLGVTGAFTVAMLLTVFFVARESEEAEAHGGKPEAPASTTAPEPPPAAPTGNAAAGKVIFTTTAGCDNCHTLKAAGSSGNVGPNLDDAKPPYARIINRVTNGKSPMPSFKGTLSPEQIQDVAAFVYESTHGGS